MRHRTSSPTGDHVSIDQLVTTLAGWVAAHSAARVQHHRIALLAHVSMKTPCADGPARCIGGDGVEAQKGTRCAPRASRGCEGIHAGGPLLLPL